MLALTFVRLCNPEFATVAGGSFGASSANMMRKLQPRLAAARDTRQLQTSVKKDGCSAEMSVLDDFVGRGQ
jgi:hypothetical protein